MLSWIFIVLAHWNYSPWVDMLLQSDTLSWFRANQPLLFLLNAVCLAEKQQIPIFHSLVWPEKGLPLRFTTLEASMGHYLRVIEFNLFSHWYSWRITHLTLNNNHKLIISGISCMKWSQNYIATIFTTYFSILDIDWLIASAFFMYFYTLNAKTYLPFSPSQVHTAKIIQTDKN
jgi:hypothetical protein